VVADLEVVEVSTTMTAPAPMPTAAPTGGRGAELVDQAAAPVAGGGDLAGARVWNRVALWVLPVVAAVGAVLSWGSLYTAATAALGSSAPVVHLATAAGTWRVNLVGASFPLLVDALILGASARYVAGVKAGRPVAGWRLAAHAGVVGTVLLNADAAPTLADVPWHVTAPIVWSVLVELVARDVLGQLRAVAGPLHADRIPVRLWVTAPVESARVSWRMARTGIADATRVRAMTERCAAAADLLAVTLPGPPGTRNAAARRQIARRLWSGALDPAQLAHLIRTTPDPKALHRTVLQAVAGLTHAEPAGPATGHAPAPSSASAGAPQGAPTSRPAQAPPMRRPGRGAVRQGGARESAGRADDATLAALIAQARAEHAAGERAGAGERTVRALLKAAGLSASNDRIRQALADGPAGPIAEAPPVAAVGEAGHQADGTAEAADDRTTGGEAAA
jgi:hypothetical protein